MWDSDKLAEPTALHEAGHALAHERLELAYDRASVMWRDLTFGRVAGESIEHVWSRVQVDPTVIA